MKRVVLLLILWIHFSALADDFDIPGLTDQPDPDAPSPTFEENFIKGDIAVSEWFDGVADGLDLFLVGKRITKKKNETNVNLENATFYTEGGGLKNETALNVNLRLPNLEEYAQLKFTSYDETQDHGVQSNYLRQQPRERSYGATVGLFKKLGNVRTAFQPRIGLQDPLDISHSLTFESIANFKTYQVNPKVQFFADAKKGPGVFQALNFYLRLTKIYSLTFINEFEYQDRPHLFIGDNGVSLGQMITKNSSMSYGILLISNNQTVYHLETYSFSVAWSHTLYRRILSYQIIPHWDFTRLTDFTGRTGLTFNVSLNF
jgi:hypothetical protein